MTDEQLAAALVSTNALERQARADMREATDPDDRKHGEIVMRQALGLRRSIENAITARACRAIQQQ